MIYRFNYIFNFNSDFRFSQAMAWLVLWCCKVHRKQYVCQFCNQRPLFLPYKRSRRRYSCKHNCTLNSCFCIHQLDTGPSHIQHGCFAHSPLLWSVRAFSCHESHSKLLFQNFVFGKPTIAYPWSWFRYAWIYVMSASSYSVNQSSIIDLIESCAGS